jgi:hypothetical protein
LTAVAAASAVSAPSTSVHAAQLTTARGSAAAITRRTWSASVTSSSARERATTSCPSLMAAAATACPSMPAPPVTSRRIEGHLCAKALEPSLTLAV